MSKLQPPKNESDPRWGADNRDIKALSIFQAVSGITGLIMSKTVWLDIGCGSGGITYSIAPKVKSITGIDPESWVRWDTFQNNHDNLVFLNESVESLSCKDNSIDVVICNQVYEHVPDPIQLIHEIHRVLKPGGICYFAGPNLLFPIEPHVFWPFVHWLPRNIAVKIMKLFGSKKILDAYSADYWTLKRWLSAFEIKNALPYILKNPCQFSHNGIIWNAISYFPEKLITSLSFLSPSFIFLIEKK